MTIISHYSLKQTHAYLLTKGIMLHVLLQLRECLIILQVNLGSSGGTRVAGSTTVLTRSTTVLTRSTVVIATRTVVTTRTILTVRSLHSVSQSIHSLEGQNGLRLLLLSGGSGSSSQLLLLSLLSLVALSLLHTPPHSPTTK